MSQLITRPDSDLMIVDQQVSLLFHILKDPFHLVLDELLEKNPVFFQTLFSVYYPFSPELALKISGELETGSLHYSSFNPETEEIRYAQLGLSFNERLDWEKIRQDAPLCAGFQRIWHTDSLDVIPLSIDLERQYKIICNRNISMHFRPSGKTAEAYLSYEESMLSIPVYQSIFTLEQLRNADFKNYRLFDKSFYLNFEPFLEDDQITRFFTKRQQR